MRAKIGNKRHIPRWNVIPGPRRWIWLLRFVRRDCTLIYALCPFPDLRAELLIGCNINLNQRPLGQFQQPGIQEGSIPLIANPDPKGFLGFGMSYFINPNWHRTSAILREPRACEK